MLGGKEIYVLHVIGFEANIRLSFAGISARDARVAVEVVYHHIFLVFGQRSVHETHVVNTRSFSLGTQKKKDRTAYLWGKMSVMVFLGWWVARVSDRTCPSKNFCMLVKRCFPSTHSLVS